MQNRCYRQVENTSTDMSQTAVCHRCSTNLSCRRALATALLLIRKKVELNTDFLHEHPKRTSSWSYPGCWFCLESHTEIVESVHMLQRSCSHPARAVKSSRYPRQGNHQQKQSARKCSVLLSLWFTLDLYLNIPKTTWGRSVISAFRKLHTFLLLSTAQYFCLHSLTSCDLKWLK